MENTPLLYKGANVKQTKFEFQRWMSCRRTLALYCFLGFVAITGMRANLSVAIVAMVNQTFAAERSGEVIPPECSDRSKNNSSISEDGKFNWDQKTQGLVLGAYSYGYLVTQVPGGWLAGRFGGKRVLGLGVLLTAIFSLLTPLAARADFYLLISSRVLTGLSAGVTCPAAIVLWTRWAAPLERSKYTVFSLAGIDFGTIVILPISGYLCSLTQYDDGWPLTFYVFGAVAVVWLIPWMLFFHDCPAEHPRISIEERTLIETAIGSSQDKRITKLPVPWLSLFTSPAVLSLAFVAFVSGWGWYTTFTVLPTFYKTVLDFKIQQNGALAGLPFLVLWITENISAFAADWLRERWPPSVVRKLATILGFLLAASFLFPTGYFGCDTEALSVTMLSLSTGSLGIFVSTGDTNPLDLSPRFAGEIMGIINVAATIPGALAPYVVGILTNKEPTRGQWRKVFIVTCGMYVSGCFVYAIFGSGKEQHWNTPRNKHPDQGPAVSATPTQL